MASTAARPTRFLESLVVTASAVAFLTSGCGDPKVMGGGPGPDVNRPGRGGSNGQGGQGGGGSVPVPTGGASGGFTLPDASSNPGGPDGGVAMPGPGMGNQCAAEAFDGKIVPLDLFFMVDISGSMGEMAGNKTKWVTVREALISFLKDKQSEGLGVGLHFFPPPAKRCTTGADCAGTLGGECEQTGVCAAPAMINQNADTCNAAADMTCTGFFGTAGQPCTRVGQCAKTGVWCTNMGMACAGGIPGDMCLPRPQICSDNPINLCDVGFYRTPSVTFADLPGNESKLTTALMDVVPNGSTPTTPAAQGAMEFLRMRAMADRNRKPVLVLATDGLPQGCGGVGQQNSIPAAAAHLSMASMAAQDAVSTYVIGVFAATQLSQATLALNQLATAGGTGMPFVLTAGQDLGQRFIDALNAIRGKALGCEFSIPAPKMGVIDYKKVNVRVNIAAGSEDLIYVGSADKCDPNKGGWYYDSDPTMTQPSRVRLCEATCNKVKGQTNARVELLFGCVTKVD
jgi:hypothetical protein